MNRRSGYQGPDFRNPSERKAATSGLSERLARRAAERDRLLLPVFVPPQVPDKRAAK